MRRIPVEALRGARSRTCEHFRKALNVRADEAQPDIAEG